MSWQKPSKEKCPECGGYMVEKGNKLVCADEQCGYVNNESEKRAVKYMQKINKLYCYSENCMII